MSERPTKTGKSKCSRSGESQPLRFLGYALPCAKNDELQRPMEREGFELHEASLSSPVSFLDFDGVVVFAGAFEKWQRQDWDGPELVCVAPADRDRREREFFSGIERKTSFIFLLSNLPQPGASPSISQHCDLFRRVVLRVGVDWRRMDSPCSAVESRVSEFRDYVSRYGTGYLALRWGPEYKEWVKPICSSSGIVFGLVLFGKIFLLPCTRPDTHGQVLEMTAAAVEAVIAYRKRMSKEMPEWTAEFAFDQESALRSRADELHGQVTQIEGQIDSYISFKGALVYQSDALVEVVRKLLDRFFGIPLTIDDKYIEDATLQNAEGVIEVVVEIKGVKGNFKRENVNQVDSHRERLKLLPTIPGVLIMNTLMGATSLQEKDEAPHPDIIQKAVADRVLLIRTLDLLRYADGVEKGIFTKEAFRQTLLCESGWLRVEGDVAQVKKK